MSAFCPRCGTDWDAMEPCPSCGYRAEHPGVLASFGRATGELWRRPATLLPFLLPVALLAPLGLLLDQVSPEDAGVVGSAALVAALFLHAWWFLAATGFVARAQAGAQHRVPLASVVAASGLGAAVGVVPAALLTALVAWAPGGTTGALAQLAVLVLLVVLVWVGGRVVGVPVESGSGTTDPVAALKRGSQRARENGGVGFVFLFLSTVATVWFAVALAVALDVVELPRWGSMALLFAVLWLLEAWLGVAVVHGLSGSAGPVRSFTCPRCGARARAEGGRARCACGLEGPLYRG